MTILELIRTNAKTAHRLIGIGLGPQKAGNQKIYTAAYNVLRGLEHSQTQLCLIGVKDSIAELQEIFPEPVPGLILIADEDPTSYLIEHLF
ncbi:MAG: hypothetical protein KAR20_06130, partial [Candidatus Heimdallarchaeota archaeon]|nr:hypothetical protein [Candidatus Heimdallarchaeota archaeon]